MRHCMIAVACLLASFASALLPAQAPRYRAGNDTIRVAIENPYRMFWVRGGDTLGDPVRELTVETQLWKNSGDRLVTVVHQQALNVSRRSSNDTLTLAPDGRVLLIGGKTPAMQGRVDFTLRLPHQPLAIGRTWADTMDSRSSSPGGDRVYRVERHYRVAGAIDSLGARLLRVEATGTVRYRDGWWADSSAGTRVWLDVTGPLEESFVFDTAGGRLVGRSWKMTLRGRGSIPNMSGGADTLPAGLDSRETQSLLDAATARRAMRALPGLDSSLSLNGGTPVLLHTVRHSGDTIESGMARNDGLVGTTVTRLTAAVVDSYSATWTSGVASATERSVRHVGDSLRVTGGGADTTVVIPTADWGVADYAMEESLAPILVRMARDTTTRPFSVWRPYARHWDIGLARVRAIDGGYLAIVQFPGQKQPSGMLIGSDGDYLYGANSGPTGAERVPFPGSARRARAEALLKAAQQP